MKIICWLSLVAFISVHASFGLASPRPANEGSSPQVRSEQNPTDGELFESFSSLLNNTVFIGHFTLGDATKPLKEERYEILRVVKMPNGDYWRFDARIKYGEHDLTVPLLLEVKWADRTPVITVDNVTIPALGTFNARVVIDGSLYAGTWSHGAVAGHLFGKIEQRAAPPAPPKSQPEPSGERGE